jgi:hypothetical protein
VEAWFEDRFQAMTFEDVVLLGHVKYRCGFEILHNINFDDLVGKSLINLVINC